MAGRKLLYMLRRPLNAAQAESLLPGKTSSPLEDDISVVLLDAAVTDTRAFPGRTFVLQENLGAAGTRSDATVVSYADLLRMVVEADSTIVI
jgi:hypothetical protein